jgi:hypothetical protein
MDKKWVLLVIVYNKIRRTYMRIKHEEITRWMYIAIEKQNLSNNEWKVLRIHMKLVHLTLGIK